eukprot:scaffold188659_cov30-Tisochrysis_lutea.AAC.4
MAKSSPPRPPKVTSAFRPCTRSREGVFQAGCWGGGNDSPGHSVCPPDGDFALRSSLSTPALPCTNALRAAAASSRPLLLLACGSSSTPSSGESTSRIVLLPAGCGTWRCGHDVRSSISRVASCRRSSKALTISRR